MSPFPAMAASFQSSPHLYAPPARRFSHSSTNSSSSSSSGSVNQRSYRNLSMRTFSCHARPEHQVSLHSHQSKAESAPVKSVPERFAWISSSKSKEATSVAVPPPQPIPPASSSVGSPLFWIGVGVGFSAIFSIVASNLKKYAMQQAMKAMMGGMNTQNSPFNTAGFPPGSPSPFSSPSPFTAPSPFVAPPSSSPTSSPVSATQPRTVDISATKVESSKVVKSAPTAEPKVETPIKEEPKKYAFTDVSPEETQQKSPFEGFSNVSDTTSPKDTQYSGAQYTADASQNGAASFNSNTGAFGGPSSAGPGMSVDALEKMMEDPTVQKMVFPYLPEEMRNPDTFKWMLQNPQYRRQLEDMLNNMGGSNEWDSRMMDSLKNFDLSSPEVKQQFDQIGLTPEEVISKIMANPEVAMAFQNPRVQQAIMDCSQNPMSIAKYQNDKEVMDVFNKISELFPGVTGP